MHRNTVTRILALCGIIAPVLIVSIIFIAAANTPGYSHIHDTISKLSEQGSASPELMTIGFIVYGVLVIGFSYALYIHLRHGFRAHLTWAAFVIYGLCMILAGFYQDIPGGEGVPLNPEGVAHNAVIITSCISFLIGMWAFAGSVYNRHSWAGFTWFTLIASFVGLILSIVFAVQSHIPASGLWQRLFYLLMVTWIEIVSIWLFRLSFKEE